MYKAFLLHLYSEIQGISELYEKKKANNLDREFRKNIKNIFSTIWYIDFLNTPKLVPEPANLKHMHILQSRYATIVSKDSGVDVSLVFEQLEIKSEKSCIH